MNLPRGFPLIVSGLAENTEVNVHDTALRDLAALVERGILVRNPEGGRSTSYSLAKVT
jgi:Fic family protein